MSTLFVSEFLVDSTAWPNGVMLHTYRRPAA